MIVAVLTLGLLSGAPAPEVAAATAPQETVHVAARVDGAAKAPTVEEVRKLMRSAERAVARGELSYARSKYGAAVELERARGVLPVEATWRLAAVHYALGEARRAAEIMDGLVSEARSGGHAGVAGAALLEASHLYELAGDGPESMARLQSAVELLSTAELPAETRLALLRRMRP